MVLEHCWLEQLSICSEDCWFEERGAVKSCNSISAGQHQHGKASLNWLTHTLTWDISRTTVYHSCHMCFWRYQQHSIGTGLFFLKIWLVESERTQGQQKWQPTSGFGLKTEQVTTDGTRLSRMSSPALWSYSYIVIRQICCCGPYALRQHWFDWGGGGSVCARAANLHS